MVRAPAGAGATMVPGSVMARHHNGCRGKRKAALAWDAGRRMRVRRRRHFHTYAFMPTLQVVPGVATGLGAMLLPDSLAKVEDLVGFFSYAREDDDDSDGALSNIRDRIQKELRQLLGRRKGGFKLWQDKTAIPHGKMWEQEIRRAVQESVFFVPIITPTAIASHYCKLEFDLFLKREAQLLRNDLVFPILYIRVPDLENEALWRRSEVLTAVGERQFADWREFRQFKLQDEKDFRIAVEKFCNNI